MKLANYFYLSGEETAYNIFREAFRPQIPDSAVRQLVKRCLQEITPGVQLYEWFLMERRPLQITENNMSTTITANIYIKSSDDSKLFLDPPVTDIHPLGIGFSAIARPRTIYAWVNL
jgi:hypothetical protein